MRTLERERCIARQPVLENYSPHTQNSRLGHAHYKRAEAAPHISQRILAPLMREVLRHPRLSYRINQGLKRYPSIYQHLLAIARRSGIIIDLSANNPYEAFPNPQSRSDSTLLAEARAIYAQLKAEARKNEGETLMRIVIDMQGAQTSSRFSRYWSLHTLLRTQYCKTLWKS